MSFLRMYIRTWLCCMCVFTTCARMYLIWCIVQYVCMYLIWCIVQYVRMYVLDMVYCTVCMYVLNMVYCTVIMYLHTVKPHYNEPPQTTDKVHYIRVHLLLSKYSLYLLLFTIYCISVVYSYKYVYLVYVNYKFMCNHH